MADAALARREARRKRILENSHNRLQLISNITNEECCKESPVKNVRTSISEQNNEIAATTIENTPIRETYNGVIINEPVTYETLSDGNLQDVFYGEQEVTNDSTGFAFPQPEKSEASIFEKLTTYKYDLVLLSLLIQLLHSFSLMTDDNNFFFLPIVLYTTTKTFLYPKQESSTYSPLLMLLNGINPQRIRLSMSILHWTNIIGQDICIYLFATICMQLFCIAINELIF